MRDQARTLQELEGDDWGEAEYESRLVRTIHALRRKPIQELTVEDLRIMLGQKVGAEFLMPLALERLEADPFSEGHFYAGDLLVSVMDLPADYWLGHPSQATRMAAIADRVARELDRRDETEDIKAHIRGLLARAWWRASSHG